METLKVTKAESRNLQAEFQKKGYVIQEGLFSPEEATALIDDIKAAETIDGVSALNKGAMTFYSGVFFNSPKLQAIIAQPKVVNFLIQVIGPDFWVRWDQAVAKGPGAGTFPWHQDNSYNALRDGHYQFWIALTDSHADNGGLWLVPGSHKQQLPHRQVDNHMVYQGTPENPICIEAKAGDVVLFSSFALHKTTPNITKETRWAYVIEYMSLDHFDPGIKPPYFVVARDGKPVGEFVRSYRGQRNLLNHLKYWKWQVKKLLGR